MDEKNLNGMMDPEDSKHSARDWFGLAQGEAINFMNAHELEKLTMEDGAGNKAVLKRLKDNAIKVDITSSSIL